jgi:hypothetical protein
MASLDEVRTRYEQQLMSLPNVVGVSAETIDGEDVLLVLVSQKAPTGALGPDQVVPSSLDGIPVRVLVVGEPTAPPSG